MSECIVMFPLPGRDQRHECKPTDLLPTGGGLCPDQQLHPGDMQSGLRHADTGPSSGPGFHQRWRTLQRQQVSLHPLIHEVTGNMLDVQFLILPLDVPLVTYLHLPLLSLSPSLSLSTRYRRSYDSEFTAPLVAYHVWPALVEGDGVIVKGEAVTRRGALVLMHLHSLL